MSPSILSQITSDIQLLYMSDQPQRYSMFSVIINITAPIPVRKCKSFIFWICIVYKQVQWAHFTFQQCSGTIYFDCCNTGSTPGGVLLINFIHSFCWYTSAKPKQTQVMWVYIQITDITKTMTLVVYYLTGLQWAVEISASMLHMLVTEGWTQ